MDDLDAASLEDVAKFFKTYYTPDNAVLTIAGDVELDHVRELVENYFAPVARGTDRPALPSMDVPPTFGGWRRETVLDKVMLPRLFLASRSPTFGGEAYYAASVCSAILGLKVGSRLHRSLVRRQRVASSASAFTFDLVKGADLFVLDATAAPGVDVDTLEEAVIREVDTLVTGGVTPTEVQRAIALLTTDYMSSLQGASARADLISKFVMYFGDASLVNAQSDFYRATNVNEVMRFVESHLGPDNRISLRFVPAGGDADA